MAKVTEVILELKEGLPNYSARTATVKVVADEEESLDVTVCLMQLRQEIRNGFRLEAEAVPQGAATAQPVAPAAAEEPKKSKKAKEEAKAPEKEAPKATEKPAEKAADKPVESAKIADAPKSSLSSFLDED